ncbi:LysR family transcriptional regulator [Dankookia sp. P2]|uniref:LysR family transcriptional regulator n=1 Tax=Dankookia sp. P2 TaxID=3423955 RepID=UPI003D66D746
MSSLNLHHLRLFHAVAHQGSLTGAARQLNLSPSALSAQLRTLEQSLGQDLFERRGRRLVVTEAGRLALDHADAIFRAAADLTATLRETGRPRRALRVGALATLSRNFQMRFLRPLLGRADVEVVLRSGPQGELLRGLETLDLDVVLTNFQPAQDAGRRYLVQHLDEQPVGLIGTAARIGAGAPLATLLAREPLILPTAETAIRAAFDGLVARLGLTVTIAAEVDDMAMISLAGARGCGAGGDPADCRAGRAGERPADRGACPRWNP